MLSEILLCLCMICHGQSLVPKQQSLSNNNISSENDERNPYLILFNTVVPEGRRLDEMNDINGEYFLKNTTLKLVSHGWARSTDTPSVREIVQGYLKFGNSNILAYDWRYLASQSYPVAVENVRKVGEILATCLIEFIDTGVASHGEIHLIGHSLGAHVMAFAGQRIFAITNNKVARITGLDTAGPDFRNKPLEERLDAGDADFVDGIHTDYLFGYRNAYGHVDMFPNEPYRLQPGCSALDVFCSHVRAFEYFAESIGNPNSFLATKCESFRSYKAGECNSNPTTHMGEHVSTQARGKYFLDTNSKRPYSLT